MADLNAKRVTMDDCDRRLATIGTTLQETAVLEAGRLSLDHSATVEIVYENDASLLPLDLKIVK